MRQPNPIAVQQAHKYQAAQLERAAVFSEVAALALGLAERMPDPTDAGHYRAVAEVLMNSAGFLAQHGLRFAEEARVQWGPTEKANEEGETDDTDRTP